MDCCSLAIPAKWLIAAAIGAGPADVGTVATTGDLALLLDGGRRPADRWAGRPGRRLERSGQTAGLGGQTDGRALPHPSRIVKVLEYIDKSRRILQPISRST
jgi:hypothetical protein